MKTKITLITLTFFIILTLSGTVFAGESDSNTFEVVQGGTNLSAANETPGDSGHGENSGSFPDPYNTRTMESFTTIQEAINDADTQSGDTIWVQPGTYNENVIVNKQLTIMPWPSMPGTVTINAGGTGSCIRITSAASGSTIQGFILTGATQSSTAGVYLDTNANNCNILQNTMANNWAGMFVWSSFNQIYENLITDNNRHGIRLVSGSGYNNIYSNVIKNNNLNHASGAYGGITTSTVATGNDNIYLNQIVGNYGYQIYGQGQNSITANNNWWGSNSSPTGIYGNVICSNWLVLGITANHYSIANGQSSIITADLTHNFNGATYNDIAFLGHVKDGIPISFIFTGSPLGTLDTNSAYTLNGNATATFTASSPGTSQINATLDSANVHTSADVMQTPCDIVIAAASLVTMTKEFRATPDGPAITTANLGDTIYTVITLINHGPDPATIYLSETPVGVDLNPGLRVEAHFHSQGLVMSQPVEYDYTWDVGPYTVAEFLAINPVPVFPGNSTYPGWATFTIKGIVNQTGLVNNTANITAQNTTHPLPLPSATAQLTVPGAHVTLEKTVTGTTNYWEQVTFHITAHNSGPDDAEGVQVTDLLPAGLTYISSTPSGTTTYNPLNGIWNIGTLTYGGPDATLDIIANITSTGPITNWANVTAQTTPDYLPFNSTNTTLNVPLASIITLEKEFWEDTGVIHVIDTANYQDFIWTIIKARNTGPDDTSNVLIQDILPLGLVPDYDSIWISEDGANHWSLTSDYSGNIWTIASFPNGAEYWLAIWTQVNQTGHFDNLVNQTSQETYHPPLFPSATAYLDVPDAAHVTLTKTADNTAHNYWQLVTFTITAHNNGPDNAEGVEITDILPSGLTWVSDDGSGTYDHNTGIWDVGTIIYGGPDPVLNIVANVTSTGQIINWANVTEQTTYDNQPFNSTSLTLEVPDAALLELNKTVSNSSPLVHDTILYTLIVQNHGPHAATSVNVTDVLPLGGLNFVGVDSVDYGSYANGVWSIPNLPANTVAHLVLRFTVERAGTIENRANITSMTWDPELYPHNVNVTINAQNPAEPINTMVNAQNLEKTVVMQETGVPISAALFGLLMIFGGLIYVKRD